MAVYRALRAVVRGISRVVMALLAAAITIGVLAGIPWALLHYAGNPIPHSMPTMDAVKHTLTSPMTPQLFLKALSVIGWYLWLVLAASFLVELVYATRQVNAPHIPTLGPTQALAAALITAIGITALLRVAPVHAADTSSAPAPSGGRVAATAPLVAGSGLSGAHHSFGSTRSAGLSESVHTVRPGESLYSIAAQDLGNGDDWPQLYTLNQGVVQADGDKLTNPDLIRPDWKIRITSAAAKQAAPAPQTTTEPATHAPTNPTAPTPTTTPNAHSAPATPPTTPATPPHPAPAAGHDQHQAPAQRRHGGTAVSLPDGGTIGITLAIALGSALVLARRWRTRLADPRFPVPEPDQPGTLLAARRAQLLLTATPVADEPGADQHNDLDDDLFDIEDPTVGENPAHVDDRDDRRERHADGDEPGEEDHSDDELDEFGAPTGPSPAPRTPRFNAPLPPGSISAAERDGTELPLAPTGPGLGLIGPGAAGAARAIAAAVLSAGAPDRPEDLARLVIPADDLAALLGVEAAKLRQITRGVPELTVTPDLEGAIGEAEVHALWRTRLLAEYEVPDLDVLATEHPEEVDSPPLVLMASPTRTLAPRINALIDDAAALRITTVLLGSHPDGATAFVEADGTVTGPAAKQWAGAQLWNLSRTGLADVLDLLARATGHQPDTDTPPTPADWPETAPAACPDSAEPAGGWDATVTVLPTRLEPAAADGLSAEDTTIALIPGNLEQPGSPHHETTALAPVAVLPVRPAPEPATSAAQHAASARAEAALAAWTGHPARITVLGGLDITVDGHPVAGLRTPARVLAALLAVKGAAGASAEQIDATCWPDGDDPERIAKWRSDGLSSLRARLGAATGQRGARFVTLDRATGRYHLNPALVTTDLSTLAELTAAARAANDTDARLEALAQAEPLCRGQLLDGELSEVFLWRNDYAPAIAGDQATVLTRLGTLAGQAGRHDQALAALEQAAALTEDNEQLYRQMFDLLANAGRHAEIPGKLRTLEAYTDSLGADISAATREAAATAMKRRQA